MEVQMTTETNNKSKTTKPPIIPPITVVAGSQPLDNLIATPVKIRTAKTINLEKTPKEDSSEEQIIEVHKFITQPAVATVNVPLKMSMDYQSIGIEIGVSIPCYAEELDAGIEKAFEMAFAKVAEKIPEIQKTLLEVSGRMAK
jgi:hypothetical protein